jgi:hypothetical protein
MERGFPDKIDLFPKIRQFGSFLVSLTHFNPEHGYSGEHHFESPLDEPVEMIKPWGLNRFEEDYENDTPQ